MIPIPNLRACKAHGSHQTWLVWIATWPEVVAITVSIKFNVASAPLSHAASGDSMLTSLVQVHQSPCLGQCRLIFYVRRP